MLSGKKGEELWVIDPATTRDHSSITGQLLWPHFLICTVIPPSLVFVEISFIIASAYTVYGSW